MESLIDRLTNWGRTFLAKLKRRDWRIWLMVAAVLYALLEAFRTIVGDTTTLLLVWVFRGLAFLVSQPMGVGGLALLAILAVLMCISWWETRPKSQPEPVTTPEVSETERRLIQDIRTLWNRHGTVPVSQLRDLLRDAVYLVRQRAYWGDLLNPVVDELDRRIADLTSAVAFGSNLSITQVRDRFNDMYSSYFAAMKWLARLEANGDVTFEESRLQRLKWWRENHYDFRERLEDLYQVPEHHQTLNIFTRFLHDEAVARFLRAAETRPMAQLPPQPHERVSQGLIRSDASEQLDHGDDDGPAAEDDRPLDNVA